MNKEEEKEFKITRAQSEFTINILKLYNSFISTEEPSIKLTNLQKIQVLSQIINKKLNR